MQNKTNKTDFQDVEWVQETLADNTRAFDNIVLKYQDQVYTLIFRTIGNRADAEDLAQNVFVNAFSNLRKFRKESSFWTWLYSIAINQIRNYWRSKKHKFVYTESDIQRLTETQRIFLIENCSAEGDGDAGPEETKRIADALISILPPLQKEIFVLFYILGHSCEEISEVLDTSPANIKIQLFRGRKRLFGKFKNLLQ
jgi:RNA polymerase sigma-70 factor (ECF subfamily)